MVPGRYGIARLAQDAAGIVSSLVAPLSAAGISVFVLCTFDGEHLLVAERDMAQASALLEANGHRFVT